MAMMPLVAGFRQRNTADCDQTSDYAFVKSITGPLVRVRQNPCRQIGQSLRHITWYPLQRCMLAVRT